MMKMIKQDMLIHTINKNIGHQHEENLVDRIRGKGQCLNTINMSLIT